MFVTEKLTSNEFGFPALIKNLTFFPVVLSKVFLPISLPIYPMYDSFSIISGLLIAIVLGYYTVNLYRKKQWIPLLGIIWFLIFISPPMLYRQKDFDYVIINLEQRVYLPLIGLVLPLAYEISGFISKGKSVAILFASMIVLLIYAGIATVHADDYRDAVNYSNAAIKKNPANAGAYTYLGFNCFERQDVPGAFDNFSKAIDIAQYPMAYFNRGAIKAAAGDNKGAEEDFNSALARDTTLDLAYFKRGSVKFLMNRYDEALEDLRHAEKLNPTDPLIFNMKGKVYNGQQKYHDAIEEFAKAIKLAPAFIEPYEGRSLARFNVRDFEGTVNDCQKILNLRPNDINTYKNMGQAYREMQKYDKSLIAYTNAIKLDSTFAPAYFGRGLTKRMMNDIDGWKADWLKAGQYGFQPPQPAK
jgi:tetratricopeptide (TPR) repeat protein